MYIATRLEVFLVWFLGVVAGFLIGLMVASYSADSDDTSNNTRYALQPGVCVQTLKEVCGPDGN